MTPNGPLVPTLRVGIHEVTLCDVSIGGDYQRPPSPDRWDAERPNDIPTQSVGTS